MWTCVQANGTNITKLSIAVRNSFAKALKNREINIFFIIAEHLLSKFKNVQISI